MMSSVKESGEGPGLLHYVSLAAQHLISMTAGAVLLYLSLRYSDTETDTVV